ncbi:MAG: Hint domain-containing protein [Pseudomonadota bacterium]
MAIFNFTVPIYGFDQWSAAASTNNTVSYPNGTSFTLDANPVLTVIDVQDDDGNPVGSPDNEFDDGFIDPTGDGSPPSTANNDQVLTQDVTINGQNFFVGDQVELEFAFTTTTGETFWVIRIDEQNVGISGPVLPQPGTTYTVNGSLDGQQVPVGDVPCFTSGSLVQTPNGVRPIETLRAGDLVVTLDRGVQPIKWAGARHVSALEQVFFEDVRPIAIGARACGGQGPSTELRLSPNHRVMISTPATELYFAEPSVLVAAKHLVNGTSVVRVDQRKPVSYHHLLLEHHDLLLVNGLACESLYPGFGEVPEDVLLDLELHGALKDHSVPYARPVLRRHEALLVRAELALPQAA